MRYVPALIALLLIVAASQSGEITTLDGETIKCDIVAVTDKEVAYKIGNKEHSRAIDKILKIDFRETGKIPEDKNFSQVDLTDGTSVLVSKWSIKGKDLEMTLLSGPTVKLPVSAVGAVLNEAKQDKYRTQWRNRVINTRGKEALVVRFNPIDKKTKKPAVDDKGNPIEIINNLPGTLGDGDAKGETITAVIQIDNDPPQKIVRKQSELHGIIFKNTLPPKAPAILCRLLDTMQNLVIVSSVSAREGGGVIVTTPSGAKLAFAADQIASIDYTKGKLDYLSALTPTKTNITPNLFDKDSKVEKWYVYKDNNLHMNPIKVGGTSYRHGLTLMPGVELEYELQGQYREFSAVVGIDDETKAEGEGTLEILGDQDKVLASVPIVYRTEKGKNGEPTKPARPVKKVNLNIKDVQTLKVIFKAKDDLNALSISVSLGDAKVNK